jgi:cobalt-zinc-cadmium efflux system membrane fusion protein
MIVFQTRSLSFLIGGPLLLIAACGVMPACLASDAKSADDPSVHVEDAGDASVVTVPHPEQFPQAPVSEREVRAELQCPGVIAPDVSRTVPAMSLAGGRVVGLRARLGDTVKKGQVLLTIQSPDVAGARADLKKYEADADLTRRALGRAKALSEHEALAAKELEAAVNADVKAQADLRAAHERVELLGGTNSQADSSIAEVKAPVSGVIIEQNITGSAGVKSLDNSPSLFTIADLSRVWVLSDVNENNLADVHLNDAASVSLSAFPAKPLHARVTNISRVLDPATRTAKVRLELPNPDGVLRPGMFATVTFTAQQTRKTIVVPSSAVLRLHEKDWVFVPLGGERFQRTAIRAGRDQNGIQEVLAGLRPGDRVVTNALQLSGAADQR